MATTVPPKEKVRGTSYAQGNDENDDEPIIPFRALLRENYMEDPYDALLATLIGNRRCLNT